MNDHTTAAHHVDVDELWLLEWAARGHRRDRALPRQTCRFRGISPRAERPTIVRWRPSPGRLTPSSSGVSGHATGRHGRSCTPSTNPGCGRSPTGWPATSTTRTTSSRRRSSAPCRASTGSTRRRRRSRRTCSRPCATSSSSRSSAAKRQQPMAEVPEPALPTPIEDDPQRSPPAAGQQDEVRLANARLQPRQRLVLALRELEDRSYAEIGELVGMKENAVAQLIFRARESLRIELRLAQVDPERLPEECRRFLPLLAAHLDGQLKGARREETLAHLDGCERCQDALARHARGLAPLPRDPAPDRRRRGEGCRRRAARSGGLLADRQPPFPRPASGVDPARRCRGAPARGHRDGARCGAGAQPGTSRARVGLDRPAGGDRGAGQSD